MNKNILTVRQVAEFCEVTPQTVIRWCNTGKLRCYRLPTTKARRIHRDWLDAFLEHRNVNTTVME